MLINTRLFNIHARTQAESLRSTDVSLSFYQIATALHVVPKPVCAAEEINVEFYFGNNLCVY
jgi:hypothetical protein